MQRYVAHQLTITKAVFISIHHTNHLDNYTPLTTVSFIWALGNSNHEPHAGEVHVLSTRL